MEKVKLEVDDMAHSETGYTVKASVKWQFCCLLCSKEESHGNVDLYATNESGGISFYMVVAIRKFFGVDKPLDENMPTTVCTECYSFVSSIVIFAERVDKVQRMFGELRNLSKGSTVNLNTMRHKHGLPIRDLLPLKQEPYEEQHVEVDDDMGEPMSEANDVTSTIIPPINQEVVCVESQKDEIDTYVSEKKDCEPQSSQKATINEYKEMPKNYRKGSVKVFRTCPHCDKMCFGSQALRNHIKCDHKDVVFKCTQCTHVFREKRYLDFHMLTHVPLDLRKVIPCPKCDVKFSADAALKRHIRDLHLQAGSYVCEFCDLAMNSKHLLQQHMRHHTGEKPFECEVCHVNFKTKSQLENHTTVHYPNQHTCTECGSKHNTKASLRAHMVVHSNETRYKCDLCGLGFKCQMPFKNHLLRHAGLKRYSCSLCGRGFTNIQSCRLHLRIAHPEKLSALGTTGDGGAYIKNAPNLKDLMEIIKTSNDIDPAGSKRKIQTDID